MTYFVLKMPTADLDTESLAEPAQEALLAVEYQATPVTGTRENLGAILVLCYSSTNAVGLNNLIAAESLSWTAMSVADDIVGADVLDWIADIQDYDIDGLPVGAPYRPVTTPPLTKFFGANDWNIT